MNEETCYVEVGVFQGLTLLSSALANPNAFFYGIDNFAFFDSKGQNKALIDDRIQKLKLKNISLINEDYENALENLSKYIGNKKIGVYFVDGPHDYRSQMMCLLLIKPYLADNAVILVDDSNYRHVRQANRDFLISNTEFKLIYESYTEAHPANLSKEKENIQRKGYWNGLNVIYKDKENCIEPMFPETFRDRTLYENEHLIHSFKYPDQSLILMKLFSKFRLFGLLNLFYKPDINKIGKYKSMNTFSSHLPTEHFNPSLSEYLT